MTGTKLHVSSILGSIGLASCVGLYLYFVRVADEAGAGDPATRQLYQTRAGFAFWSAVAVWCTLLLWALRCEKTERSQLLAVCGWAPVALLGLALLSLIIA